MAVKKAIVTISSDKQLECTTNGVSNIRMLYALDVLREHFARALLKEARHLFPKDEKAQEKWIDTVSKKEHDHPQGKDDSDNNIHFN